MEQLRRILVYKIFINHYIKMAKHLKTSKSYNLAIIYLKQASRLCSLMKDDDRGDDQAQNLLQLIDGIFSDVMVERNRDSETKPKLPYRESTNHTKYRWKLPRKSNKDDFDPYTNIESNIPTELIEKNNKRSSVEEINEKKSLNQRILADVHVHLSNDVNDETAINKSTFDLNEFEIVPSPHTPQMPVDSINFFGAMTSTDESPQISNFSKSPKLQKQKNDKKNGNSSGIKRSESISSIDSSDWETSL